MRADGSNDPGAGAVISEGLVAGSDVTVLDAQGATELVVPGGHMLLLADYAREGPDLMLTGTDGAQVVIQDFFAQTSPPDLMTEGGAKVSPELAARLAGPEAPGEYAALTGMESASPA